MNASRPASSFAFFGGYDPAYPRSAVIGRGLRENGAAVRECAVSPRRRFWLRYPSLVWKFFRGGDAAARAEERGAARRYIFVPEFCAKDVPLAKLLGLLSGRKVIFDPLAARYETKILDWGWRSRSTLSAWWNFRIDAVAFKLADIVLADTSVHKDYYVRTYGLNPRRAAVLPLGFDDRLFCPERAPAPPAREANGDFEVLFFGSFLPLHGVEVVAEAARLVKKVAGIRFRLIGSGRTFPAVKAFVEAHGLANVEFLGRVPLSRLPAEIGRASVCLGVFGRTEKARRVVPHKLFQAAAMGRAVITARTPAVEEFFDHRRHVYFCDEPLAASLALAILELRRDADLRASIAEQGLRLVHERHSPRAVGRLLLDLLHRFRGGRS